MAFSILESIGGSITGLIIISFAISPKNWANR